MSNNDITYCMWTGCEFKTLCARFNESTYAYYFDKPPYDESTKTCSKFINK